MAFLKSLFDGSTSKALLGALGAAGSAFIAASTDGVLSGAEIGEILGALLAGFGLVYLVPFVGVLKAVVATGVAVAGSLVVAIDNGGGITHDEWYAVIGIIAAAIATHTVPNATATTVGAKEA